MKSYIYALLENDTEIDRTSLNEENINLASELFFSEFGHDDCKHMSVVFIEEVQDDE